MHGRTEASRWAGKKYPNFTFKKETVRDWKTKYQKDFEARGENGYCTFRRQGRSSMVSDELQTQVVQ